MLPTGNPEKSSSPAAEPVPPVAATTTAHTSTKIWTLPFPFTSELVGESIAAIPEKDDYVIEHEAPGIHIVVVCSHGEKSEDFPSYQ